MSKATIHRVLFTQSSKKESGPDSMNFLALRLLWRWDTERVMSLIRQCITEGHRPHAWHIAKGIPLCEPNKMDHTQVELHRIISFLNSSGKVAGIVAEKMVEELKAESCELDRTLH